ncbi:MAG: citrate lyase holo-[acyl-carrier protein] synthase [Christensenellales bacterium]|jgi:holo-ACP synthase/triphosphoribosyl-dephospho-CoA synthase
MLHETPQPVSVSQMAQAREARARRQLAMLEKWQMPLISFTLNIPGPVKNNPLIAQGFDLALKKLTRCLAENSIPILEKHITCAFTGDEALFTCEAEALILKRLLSQLEEADDLGRLMDVDVLDVDGGKIPREAVGLPPRQCLLCGQPAHRCAPIRAHSAEELFQKATLIIRLALYPSWARHIGHLAQKSLVYEALATPKPGLVDRVNSGAHQDMDIFTLMDSAAALGGYFEAAALCGMRLAEHTPPDTMRSLRPLGLEAEAAMYAATNGINTHKGAIYALGILCAAAGRLKALESPLTPDALFEAAGHIAGEEAHHLSQLAQNSPATNGLRLYAQAGITGARGEAASGFPTVRYTALPWLRRYLAMEHSMNDALVFTLIHLILLTQDTNLIKRAGLSRYQEIQRQIKALLLEGSLTLDAIYALDVQFITENLSPGGSADLLAVACLAHWLTH